MIEVTQINVTPVERAGRLCAVCELVINRVFIIKEIKIISTKYGNIVRLPEKEVVMSCPYCKNRNHLRARFCNACGAKLTNGKKEKKINTPLSQFFYPVVFPMSVECREYISNVVLSA
ncbi:MAG: zinc ribbon domain-containing protein, partial [Planctomycetota bacterium]